MDAEDEPMPPSRHNFKREPEPEPEPSKSVVYHAVPEPIVFAPVKRQDTFDMIKKRTPREFPAPPQNSVLIKPEPVPDAGFAPIEISEANTVPYTMKFISLNGGRTWYEVYKVHCEVRQFNYGAQVFYLPILHLADEHAVYGRLYDSSDKAIKSILYKKVNAKELIADDDPAPHTTE